MTFWVSSVRMADYDVTLCLEKAWRVRFLCTGCDRGEVFWGEAELRALPPTTTLGQLASAAVCSVCKATEGEISLRTGHWGERSAYARG
jgi:hypothetical protein